MLSGRYPTRSAMSVAARGSAAASETAIGWPVTATCPAIPWPTGTRNCLTSSASPPTATSKTSSSVSSSTSSNAPARARSTCAAVATIICRSSECVTRAPIVPTDSARLSASRRLAAKRMSSALSRAAPSTFSRTPPRFWLLPPERPDHHRTDRFDRQDVAGNLLEPGGLGHERRHRSPRGPLGVLGDILVAGRGRPRQHPPHDELLLLGQRRHRLLRLLWLRVKVKRVWRCWVRSDVRLRCFLSSFGLPSRVGRLK